MMTAHCLVVALGFCSVVACGSGDDAAKSGSFKDESGRSCQIAGDEITCTGEGAVCDPPATATFIVEKLLMSPMRVCGACLESDDTKSYDSDSCKQVVCAASSECGFPEAECKQGYCWCMPGMC
jgi:hypothetical protein